MRTRDRFGEKLDDDTDHDCRRGWLSPHDAVVAIPCLMCRPHLAMRQSVNQTARTRPRR